MTDKKTNTTTTSTTTTTTTNNKNDNTNKSNNKKKNITKKEEKAEEQTSLSSAEMFFTISLAQWSLHRTIRAGKLDNLDFAVKTKTDFGISAVEYVNQFFKDKGKDMVYLREMKKRAEDNGVASLLIMVDREGKIRKSDFSNGLGWGKVLDHRLEGIPLS